MILKPKSTQLSTMYATNNLKHRKHLERVFESDHPKFTMKHAIQLCSGTVPVKLNYQMPPQPIQERTLQRIQERTPQRTSQLTPHVAINQILNSNRSFSTSFIFGAGTRIYTQDQIMTPSDTESESESDIEIDVFIARRNATTNIIIDNSQNQIEIDEEIIRQNIEQLLADDDSESINEFEYLQRDEYDSES